MAETEISEELLNALVFETFGTRRFVQDSPIRPDVWLRYLRLALGGRRQSRVSLILTPRRTTSATQQSPGGAGALVHILEKRLGENAVAARIAATSRHVVVDLTFAELLSCVLPLTDWWQGQPDKLKRPEGLFQHLWEVTDRLDEPARYALAKVGHVDLMRFVALTGAIGIIERGPESRAEFLKIARLLTIPATQVSGDDDDSDDIMGARPMLRRVASTTEDEPKTFANATLRDLKELQGVFAKTMEQAFGGADLDSPAFLELTARSSATIWTVERNRRAVQMAKASYSSDRAPMLDGLEFSRDTVKADAAIRLFNLSTRNINWAVIDSGIDSTHRAFSDWAEPDAARRGTRVVRTLDFTQLRAIQSGQVKVSTLAARLSLSQDDPELLQLRETVDAIQRRKTGGRDIDWALIEPLIRVDIKPRGVGGSSPGDETVPNDGHGTHVAGILGGWSPPLPAKPGVPAKSTDEPFYGVCPDIRLYDLRVFVAGGVSPDGDGIASGRGGDEFTILAALDYVAWLNREPETPVIHGVNLSLSMRHDVKAHACGHTPVCEAANRLSAMGTVVVAAAGNAGFDPAAQDQGLGFGYRGMSITDPGNAAGVICVGATHRRDPHAYGVSFFSSRGPTGDGRLKPDLVAPGEKIRSTIPGDDYGVKDGTSMAAPHVSGVCALLMARHGELIGNPTRIRDILLRSATDLGRERYFQGAGLVDALRALQSV